MGRQEERGFRKSYVSTGSFLQPKGQTEHISKMLWKQKVELNV